MIDPCLPDAFFKRDETIHRSLLSAKVIPSKGVAQDSQDRIRIDFSGNAQVILKPSLSDLSPYNTIAVAVYNEGDTPVRVGLRLMHSSRTFRPDMNDFSTTGDREIVEPGGRREVKFHRECFGTYGLKNDWENIIEIHVCLALEWGIRKTIPFSVYLEGFFVEARRIPRGPRLTEEGLSSHALGQESLKLLASPQSIGPFNERNLGLLIPPPHTYSVDFPQSILDGYIMGQKLGLPFSWNGKPVAELEWEHFLHRHHFMRTLIRFYADTGSVEAAEWINIAIRHWIRSFPVPLDSNGGASPTWETLSVAWRIREWLWILGIVWESPRLEAETRTAMLASFWESAQSLMNHKGHPNNWVVVESGALALIGLCLSQFHEADDWFSTGLERLCAELDRQFFPDGVHFELSPLYHAICMGVLLDLLYAASWYNKPVPKSISQTLTKGMDYLAWIMRPDQTWPAINDSGGILGDYKELMEYAAGCFWRHDYSCLDKNQGELWFVPNCKTFSDAGITIIRAGHCDSPRQLLFRSGPAGASHVHRDVLSLELHALGRNWLVDPGITSYAPYESTQYYRSAGAHNIILIDGSEPIPDQVNFSKRIRSGRENTFSVFGEDVHIVSGIYRGPWDSLTGEYSWVRSVICVKNGLYFLVVDEMFGCGSHVITTGWQFAPATTQYMKETNAVLAVDTSSAVACMISPATPHEEVDVKILKGSRGPCGGWVSIEGSDVAAPLCSWDIKVDLPAAIVWLLVPVRTSEASGIRCRCLKHEPTSNIELEVRLRNHYKDILTIGRHEPSTIQGRRWYEKTYFRIASLYS